MSRERLEKARTTKTEKHALGRFNFKEAITLSSHGRFSTKQTHVTRLVSHRVYTGKHVVSEEEKKVAFACRRKCRFCARPARVTLAGSSTCAFCQFAEIEVDEIIMRTNIV